MPRHPAPTARRRRPPGVVSSRSTAISWLAEVGGPARRSAHRSGTRGSRPMNDHERAAAAARRFFDEHRAGERFTGLPPDLRPRDIDEAHAIQDRLQALNEAHGLGPLAGLEGGPHHPRHAAARRHRPPVRGRDPRGARLPESGHPPGRPTTCASASRPRSRCGCRPTSRAGGTPANPSPPRSARSLPPSRSSTTARATTTPSTASPSSPTTPSTSASCWGRETADWRDLDLPAVRGAPRHQRRGRRRGRRRSGDGGPSLRGGRVARQRPRGARARAPGPGPRHDRQHRPRRSGRPPETRSSSPSTPSARPASTSPERETPGADSEPRHHEPGELLREAPLLVDPGREHELLEALRLQGPNPFDDLLRGAGEAGRPHEVGVDELRLPGCRRV